MSCLASLNICTDTYVAYEQTSRAKIRDNFHHEQRIIYYFTDSNKDISYISI